MSYDAHFRVWRGDDEKGELVDYPVEVNEGEVVLDIIHRLQQTEAQDLAVRWNCKAGKCGSCSAEINGKPRLMCMTRMSTFDGDRGHHGHPAARLPGDPGPGHRRVVQLHQGPGDPGFAPPPGVAPGEYRMQQVDVERSQEFRKCIECYLCQNTCHVVRDHEENKANFAGPRYLMRIAELDMHPLDVADRQGGGAGGARPGLLQHHQVLHRGLPGAHQDHRQRADPAQGARGRPQVRPAGLAGQQDLQAPRRLTPAPVARAQASCSRHGLDLCRPAPRCASGWHAVRGRRERADLRRASRRRPGRARRPAAPGCGARACPRPARWRRSTSRPGPRSCRGRGRSSARPCSS